MADTMQQQDSEQQAWFEHRFWLQILGDHARFLLNALSPVETKDAEQARYWKKAFDDLLAAARTGHRLIDLNQQAYQAVCQLRAFKLSILERQITGRIAIGLPPTFLNHMVNELDEYLYILIALQAGKPVPVFEPLHYDLIWLSDAAGHAGALASEFDRVERMLIKRSTAFEKHFNALYLKAVEMAGYMRAKLRDFPAFRRFHREIDYEMRIFMKFLAEIEELELSAEALDVISPLMPDHMAREECYYLTKLAQQGLVPHPNCDPAKPRVQD